MAVINIFAYGILIIFQQWGGANSIFVSKWNQKPKATLDVPLQLELWHQCGSHLTVLPVQTHLNTKRLVFSGGHH